MLACTCETCIALAAEYEDDPDLLDFYQHRLLVRGWAGRKSPTERAYILAHAFWAQAGAAALARNRHDLAAHVYNPQAQTLLDAEEGETGIPLEHCVLMGVE